MSDALIVALFIFVYGGLVGYTIGAIINYLRDRNVTMQHDCHVAHHHALIRIERDKAINELMRLREENKDE